MADVIDLALEFVRQRPRDAARVLEDQPPDMVVDFLTRIPMATAGGLLSAMAPRSAAAIVRHLDPETAAAVLRTLAPAVGASMLRHMAPDLRDPVLGRLPTKVAVVCRLLLRFSEDTVGAWMDPRAIAMPDDLTVAETLARIRRDDEAASHRVHVLDRAMRLRGSVAMLDLVRADDDRPLVALMHRRRDTVWGRTALETAATHAVWEDEMELAVADSDARFIGVLTYAGLRRGLRQSATVHVRWDLGEALTEVSGAFAAGMQGGLEAAAALVAPVLAPREGARRGTHRGTHRGTYRGTRP
ncbi:MAG: magnesium transporter [Hyphomicrobiales bacterium]|nr:magnesium transporter [Hyphomicrobiales bacterium]